MSGITLLSFLLSLLCWTLEPTVSRDSVLYLDLIQTWHDGENGQAVLKHWPGFWISPLPLYLINLWMDCGFSTEAAGVGLNISLGCGLPRIVSAIFERNVVKALLEGAAPNRTMPCICSSMNPRQALPMIRKRPPRIPPAIGECSPNSMGIAETIAPRLLSV